MASPASPTPRLQTQNLAAGVITRFQARSAALAVPSSSRSKASVRRISSASAASLSSARSASTARISGCSARARPKAWRWRAYAMACTVAWRTMAALPATQLRRVVVAISMIVGMPRPSSPISSPQAPSNSTSPLALLRLPTLSFRRCTCTALSVPSGRQRGT